MFTIRLAWVFADLIDNFMSSVTYEGGWAFTAFFPCSLPGCSFLAKVLLMVAVVFPRTIHLRYIVAFLLDTTGSERQRDDGM